MPCEGGTPSLTSEKVKNLLTELSSWREAQNKIEREFKFKNFKEALEFVNKVGKIAEDEGHHPDILLHNWRNVKISLSTHAVMGLSENDFIVASKIDFLLPDEVKK